MPKLPDFPHRPSAPSSSSSDPSPSPGVPPAILPPNSLARFGSVDAATAAAVLPAATLGGAGAGVGVGAAAGLSPSMYEMAALSHKLDTQGVTTKVKEILLANNIGQKV